MKPSHAAIAAACEAYAAECGWAAVNPMAMARALEAARDALAESRLRRRAKGLLLKEIAYQDGVSVPAVVRSIKRYKEKEAR